MVLARFHSFSPHSLRPTAVVSTVLHHASMPFLYSQYSPLFHFLLLNSLPSFFTPTLRTVAVTPSLLLFLPPSPVPLSLSLISCISFIVRASLQYPPRFPRRGAEDRQGRDQASPGRAEEGCCCPCQARCPRQEGWQGCPCQEGRRQGCRQEVNFLM